MVRKKPSDKKSAKAAASLDPDARRSQWLKGVLELCLLGALTNGEAYGYELAQHLELAGLGDIKGGTLYPRLAALEAAGLVEIEWRAGDGGPGRKYYRLTPLGRSTQIEATAQYRRFSTVIDSLIDGNIPSSPQKVKK